MKKKAPAFQLYPKDLLADTAWLTNEEFGVYVRFLLYAWIGLPGYKQGELPTDKMRLLSLVQLSLADFEKISKQVLPYFTDLNDGRMVQKRLVKEIKKQQQNRKIKQQAGLAGANKRWQNHSKSVAENGASANGVPIAKNASSSSSSTAVIKPPKPPFDTEPVLMAVADACRIDLNGVGESMAVDITNAINRLEAIEPNLSAEQLADAIREYGGWHFEVEWKGKRSKPKWIPEKWQQFRDWQASRGVDPHYGKPKYHVAPDPGGDE